MVFAQLMVGLALSLQAPSRPIDLNPIVQSFKCDRAPVATVLSQVIRGFKLPFKIYPEVRGAVTVEFKRVPLATVVRHLAIQVDALYEIRDGAYHVFSSQATPSNKRILEFPYERTEVRIALDRLFELVPAKFEIGSDVTGFISIPAISDVSFEGALRTILSSAQADYQVKAGVYYIQKGSVDTAR